MHRLLVDAVGQPLVNTSGNVSGEPLCVDTPAAIERLGTIADLFLTHDRPITRPVDDSVVREGPLGLAVLRRARGFAPLPVFRLADDRCILGVGAHLKSSVALSVRGDVVMSQHLGDLDDAASVDLLETTVRDMVRFFDVRPDVISCDYHPDFASSRLAERLAVEWNAGLVRVQHHHAHLAGVLAERGIEHEVFGLAWDGYGFGVDGDAWGGEAFVVRPAEIRRLGHLMRFRLPGGDKAAYEPRRSALGLFAATMGNEALTFGKLLWPDRSAEALLQAMDRGFSAPWTSSMGRLFDAIAALLGIRNVCTFEGQAAMELEWCAETNPGGLPEPYPIPLSNGPLWIADLAPLVRGLVAHRLDGMATSEMAARFVSTVVDMGVRFCERAGLPTVVLAGGCFQNVLLTRALVRRLEAAGFQALLPIQVPVNDGGISAGQVAVASRMTMHQVR
jgi:hydrogenase maturation protein HypF